MENQDQSYMELALQEAREATRIGEVPIGAVLIGGGEILGRGHNLREKNQDPTAHAEIFAIQAAARKMGTWRLEDCPLYVTLEPCPMCAGAIMLARIARVVYGARDPKGGAVESLLKLYDLEGFNHRVSYQGGVMAEECGRLLSEFFRDLRQGRVSESG